MELLLQPRSQLKPLLQGPLGGSGIFTPRLLKRLDLPFQSG
jgi:hypothetical protein